MKSNKLVITLAVTTAASASVMLLSVAYRSGYPFEHFSTNTSPTIDTEPHSIEESRTMLAKITRITGTTLHVTAFFVSEKSESATYDILTNSATSVTRSVPKDQKTYAAEVEAFTAAGTQSQPPLPFTIQNVTFSSLNTGDVIFVTTTDKIVAGQPIIAAKILIQSTPVTKK